jgi:hypothetical protein
MYSKRHLFAGKAPNTPPAMGPVSNTIWYACCDGNVVLPIAVKV